MSPRRSFTIADVAARAGVSVATVSRALRGLPNVAAETGERVHRVAAELGYRPDPSAARLAAGRTRTVAMAVPHLDSWYFTRVMAGAERVLTEAGYDLLVLAVPDVTTRRRVLSGPLVKRADGLLLVDLRLPRIEAQELLDAGMAVVSIGEHIEEASLVSVDDCAVARTAVGHLADLGHRRIGLLAGQDAGVLDFSVPERRLEGYRVELAARGLPAEARFTRHGKFSVDGGHDAMAALLEDLHQLDRDSWPTAVFAMSDEMAFGAVRALRQWGLRAPRDLSMVGVDDHEFSSVLGLTTIQQEVGGHGIEAARLLLAQLSGASPSCHEAATRLIVRDTTGPLSS